MRSSLIQAHLKDINVTQSLIAANLRKSSMAVSKVINRQMASKEIAEEIALILQMPLSEVFPEYEKTTA